MSNEVVEDSLSPKLIVWSFKNLPTYWEKFVREFQESHA